jgi:hypothetical protein
MEASKVTVASPALLVGLALAVPFLALNAVVATQLEPLFSLVRPGIHTGPLEYPLLAFTLLLVATGAVVALLPVLRKSADGSRRYPVLNILVAGLLAAGFLVIAIALGEEIYRCDVLAQPFCD